MSDEEKSKELCKVCYELYYNRASFDDIRRWLDNNKDNQDLLKQAANYKNEEDITPLHWFVATCPPPDLVERFLQLAPNTIKVQTKYGLLPLNWAQRSEASVNVINMLIQAYPKATKVKNKYGSLPLHYALCKKASSDVINMLFQAYPQAVEVQDKDGCLPLHYALENNASDDVITMIFKAYPEASEKQNNYGELPFDIALRYNAPPGVIKMLFKAYPQAALVKNCRGDLPLHLALKNEASNDVLTMIFKAHSKAAKLRNNEGNTPIDIASSRNKSTDVVDLLKSALESPYYGGNGGEAFDDYDEGTLVGIAIRAGEYFDKGNLVQGLTLFYRGGKHSIMSYGGEKWNGTEEYIILRQGEYVTQATVTYSEKYVTSLLFQTNQERTLGPCGGGGGTHAKVTAPGRQMIVGIKGRVGYCIDSIGFHYRFIEHCPPPTSTSSQEANLSDRFTKEHHIYGPTPLHHACMYGFKPDDIKLLVEEYPTALQIQGKNGDFPLHIALEKNKASADVIKMLLQAYPQAVGVKDRNGKLPLIIAKENNASDNVIKMLIEAQNQIKDTLPKPTKNTGWNWRDETIYIDNKTEFELKVLVYLKASKFEAPEAPKILHVEPKKKIFYEVDKEYTGIYCDILCDESSANGELGWALNYFIEKGFTQQIIGDPKELKETMEPIEEATGENLKTKGHPDFNPAVSEEFKKSNERESCINSNESYVIEKIDLYADVKLAYLVLKKVPVISDPDEFYDSLTKLLAEMQVSDVINELKQQVEWAHWENNLLQGEVNFVLDTLFYTCKERQLFKENIQTQNELFDALSKDSDSGAEKRKLESFINSVVIAEKTGETAGSKDLQDLDTTASEEFKESYVIEKIDLYADVKLAYFVLKKIPVISDPNEFYDSLTKLLAEMQVSDVINELKQQVEWANWDNNLLQGEVNFVLDALFDTCKERKSFKDSVQSQNELFDALNKDYASGDDKRKLESFINSVVIAEKTDLDTTASEEFKESYVIEKIDLYDNVKLAYFVLKKIPVISDPDEFYDSLRKLLTEIKVSDLIEELNQQSEWANWDNNVK